MAFPERGSPISENFEIAKVLSIGMVATAHFFPNTLLWVPSTVALFVFGFASSYFTHAKYRDAFHLGPYWTNKLVRLAIPLLVIDVFLLILCSLRSSQSIWVWQTIPHLLGLGGALDWFGFMNASPLGGGMWFFTLLLVFYAFYPLLRVVNQIRVGSWVAVIAALVGTTYCHFRFPLGYSLWPTIFSFVFGAFIAERGAHISGLLCIVGGGVSILVLGLFNVVLKVNSFNYFLILAASVLLTLWLLKVSLPVWLSHSANYFSDLLLEIYLIHTYLFLTVTGLRALDYVLSLCVIVIVARVLHLLAGHLSHAYSTRTASVRMMLAPFRDNS